MKTLNDLKEILKNKKIEFKIHEYKIRDNTVDEQVRAQKLLYKEGMSTLIYRADDGYIALFRRDDMNVDRKKLKKILNIKNLELGNDEDILKLGFLKGCVSPILLDLDQIKVYIDLKVLEMEKIICGATKMTNSVELSKNDLLKLIKNYQIVDVCFPNPKRQDNKPDENGLILAGITPSGEGNLHIGNYLGSVKLMLDLQKKSKRIHFFIADLHALTTIQEKNQLQHNVENIVLSYLAFGFNPEVVTIYRQSDIPQHTELQSILNNVTPLGLIQRAHAYKDKLQKDIEIEEINMGLFNYPILMAADIILYDAVYIPVGEDQKQHVEITRDIAEYFNHKYGPTFVLPKMYPNLKEASKLIGTDGKRKMSKSLGNVIGIFEDEEIIKQQVFNCYTDPKRIHATDHGDIINNPIFIYHRLLNEDKDEVKDLEKRYVEGRVGDIEVKEKLFRAILKTFGPARARYQELKTNPEIVRKILKNGAEIAGTYAEEKMKIVKEKIGLTNKYSI